MELVIQLGTRSLYLSFTNCLRSEPRSSLTSAALMISIRTVAPDVAAVVANAAKAVTDVAKAVGHSFCLMGRGAFQPPGFVSRGSSLISTCCHSLFVDSEPGRTGRGLAGEGAFQPLATDAMSKDVRSFDDMQ